MTENRRYPFSTRDGKYIPSDILEPSDYIEIVTATSWGSPIDLTDSKHQLISIDVEYPTGLAFMPDGVTPPPTPVNGQWLGVPAGVVSPPGTSPGLLIHVPPDTPWLWSIAEKQNQTGYLFVLSYIEWNTLATSEVLTRS